MKKWKRLHSIANDDEHLEAIQLMARTAHARHTRRVFVRGRLIVERRRLQAVHYIRDRRGRYPLTRAISLIAFATTLITVSIATWVFALATWNESGAVALFFHITALMGVIAFKPYKLRTQTIE